MKEDEEIEFNTSYDNDHMVVVETYQDWINLLVKKYPLEMIEYNSNGEADTIIAISLTKGNTSMILGSWDNNYGRGTVYDRRNKERERDV